MFLSLDENGQNFFPFDHAFYEELQKGNNIIESENSLYADLPPISDTLEKSMPNLKHIGALELDVSNQRGLAPLSIITDKPAKLTTLPTPISPFKPQVGQDNQSESYFHQGEVIDQFQIQDNYNFGSFYPDQAFYMHPNQRNYGSLYDYELNYSSYLPPLDQTSKRRKSNTDHCRLEVSESRENNITKRKKTVSNSCECSGACRNKIAVIYLRGPFHELEKSYLIDVICTTCSKTQLSSSSFAPCQYLPTARKRSRDDLQTVDCEVCRKKIGHGGIRLIDSEVAFPNDLSVEFVCTMCTSKYQFCSECGGGGKARTGKWRPVELFELGRRTCSLPHLRVGDTQFQTECYSKSDLNEVVISEIQDVFFDSYLSFYAIPSSMEQQNETFSSLLKDKILPIWNNDVLSHLSAPITQNLSQFLIVEWMDKQHRNKAKSKMHRQNENNHWLRLIRQFSKPEGLNLSYKQDTKDCDRNCISFGIAEWDRDKGMIFLPQILPRSFFLKSLQTYHHIIQSTIACVQSECAAQNVRLPEYMILFGRADNTRTKGIPERLGFAEKGVYLDENPSFIELFSSLHYPLLSRPDTTVHIIKMEHFLTK